MNTKKGNCKAVLWISIRYQSIRMKIWTNFKVLILLCGFALFCYTITNYTNGFPYLTIVQDPYSVKRLQHGHINSVPGFMSSNESYGNSDSNKFMNLAPYPVPLTVHYFWCDSKQFQFNNYLSILSAYRFLKPTRIIFHYVRKPLLDSYGYYQFFPEMVKYIPILVEEQISDCGDADEKRRLIFSVLNSRGGIYIGENAILSSSLLLYRNVRLSYSTTFEIITMKRQQVKSEELTTNDVSELVASSSSHVTCRKQDELIPKIVSDCIVIDKEIFPNDINYLDTEFGKLARWIYYGHNKLRLAKKQEKLIPNIVHYVWLGRRPLKYIDYLSLLSSVFVLKADQVYVHGDVKPEGQYWQKAARLKNVHFIFREFPVSVFGENIGWKSHASDVLRGDILIRYGGIYMDWDVLWINPISDNLRMYDAVFSCDWAAAGSYPNIINLGVAMAQKGSKFMRYFLESYRHYLSTNWMYNAVYMPYKIFEKHSDLGYLEPHLQVICAEGKCHPSWLPGFKQYHHLNKLKYDWRESLSIHITYPDPEEYKSQETMLQSNTMFSDIGVFILKSAELI